MEHVPETGIEFDGYESPAGSTERQVICNEFHFLKFLGVTNMQSYEHKIAFKIRVCYIMFYFLKSIYVKKQLMFNIVGIKSTDRKVLTFVNIHREIYD